MKRTILTTAAIFAAVMMVNMPAIATACTWTGNTDTVWSTSGNWDDCGGSIPGAGDDVTIPAGRTNYPTLDVNATIDSLTIEHDATLTTSTYELVITDSNGLTIDPASGAGGSVAGILNVSASGIVELSGGGNSHTIDGRLNLLGSGSELEITNDCGIEGSGSIDGSDNAALIEITDTKTLTSQVTIEGNLVIDELSGTATFVNQGQVNANNASGTLSVKTTTVRDNTGSDRWKVDHSSAILLFHSEITAPIDDNKLVGGFDINSGTLDIDQSVTTSGAVDQIGGTIKVAVDKWFKAS